MFQGGRSGGVMKNNTTSNKGNATGSLELETSSQEEKKTRFSEVTKAWSFLNGGERDSWVALIGVWTFIDKFGDVYDGTAFQIFTAVNINRLTLELPLLSTAPIKVDAIDFDLSLSNYSLSGSWNLTRALAPPEAQYMSISISIPANATKNVSSIAFRVAGSSERTTAGVSNLKPLYNLVYGYQPPLGSFVYMRVWTALAAYPRKQFLVILKSEVVA